MSSLKQPNLNSVTSINADGSHYFIHPADVKGVWTTARKLVAWVLIMIYLALPWIPIQGHPAVFLDVETRNFHLFGFHFMPQDFWMMFFAVTGLGFTLFFVTALLGRVWCGWACPYTVFLDHIYRRIERWIEGDATARRKLDQAPWTAGKLIKRVFKHALYALIAALIAHAFLAYFVSLERLYSFMHAGPMEHFTAFGVVLFLTCVLWFCFGYFREQFCIIMCPYGRLQSALSDDETITIGYDEKRGEPRGTAGKVEGACVDCRRCVNVCPTGIDIRNGLQLECIGCAACIDACDDIMVKLKRPKGLVRYDSQAGFAGRKRRLLRPRIYAYSVLGVLGLVALVLVGMMKFSSFTATISRVSGTGYTVDAGSVSNIYLLRVKNKRNDTATLSIRLGPDCPAGYRIREGNESFTIPAEGETTRTCVIIAPLGAYTGPSKITLELHSQAGGLELKKGTRFLGPNPNAVKPTSN
ncbi:MAG: cytochrome c oxidase accessory protein CcoG [Akkermansiaceae bacterium]|nr:cytochrome c oxidase accessory protein CcoG [Akkermansiaceae bacterium]MCF7732290.1 cytochrome c oxidase accessory protein CcoG [Akkermansiaceae bacterium]